LLGMADGTDNPENNATNSFFVHPTCGQSP
jgi:hypothetical protein